MPALTFPTGIFNNPNTGKSLALGKMYVGTPDTDPEVLINRVSVTVVQENGDTIVVLPAAQPFIFNAAGMLQYNGSVVQMRVTGDASMKIVDANDVELMYFPSTLNASEVSTSGVQIIAGGTPTPVPGSGIVYTKMVDGIAELFYMDSIGQELQFTSNGQFNIDIAESIIEVLQLLAQEAVEASQFRGDAVILEYDENDDVICDLSLGTAYFLNMTKNVNNFTFINMPEIRLPTLELDIVNAGSFTVGSFEPVASGWEVWVPETVEAAQPAENTRTCYGISMMPGVTNKAICMFPVPMRQTHP